MNNRIIELVSRHRNFDQLLLNIVIEQNNLEIEKTAEGKMIMKMYNQVVNEYKSMKDMNYVKDDEVVFLDHTPRNNIEDLIVNHFSNMFPGRYVVFESLRGEFIGKNREIIMV